MMMRSLIRSWAYSVLATALSYFLIILLARTATGEALSSYLYATTWGIMLALAVDAAADQCGVHFNLSMRESLGKTLAGIFALKAGILAVCVVMTIAINATSDFGLPMAAFLFVVPAFYLGPVFELRGQNILFARILFFERLAFFLLAAGYTLIFGLDGIVYVLYLGITLVSLVAQFVLLNLRPSTLFRLQFGFLKKRALGYVAVYWPVYAILLAQMGYGHFSRLFVEAKVGLVAFGAVTLAFQLTNGIQVIQTQVDRHFRPLLMRASSDGRISDIRRLAGRYTTVYILPLVIVACLVAILSEPIIRIVFGSGWPEAGVYLRYLSPLIVTVPLLKFLDIAVVVTASQRFNLVLNIGVLAGLVACLAAMPAERPVPEYLMLVVAFQALHVGLAGVYIARRLRLGSVTNATRR